MFAVLRDARYTQPLQLLGLWLLLSQHEVSCERYTTEEQGILESCQESTGPVRPLPCISTYFSLPFLYYLPSPHPLPSPPPPFSILSLIPTSTALPSHLPLVSSPSDLHCLPLSGILLHIHSPPHRLPLTSLPCTSSTPLPSSYFHFLVVLCCFS